MVLIAGVAEELRDAGECASLTDMRMEDAEKVANTYHNMLVSTGKIKTPKGSDKPDR
jgi:hypothetical protein